MEGPAERSIIIAEPWRQAVAAAWHAHLAVAAHLVNAAAVVAAHALAAEAPVEEREGRVQELSLEDGL